MASAKYNLQHTRFKITKHVSSDYSGWAVRDEEQLLLFLQNGGSIPSLHMSSVVKSISLMKKPLLPSPAPPPHLHPERQSCEGGCDWFLPLSGGSCLHVFFAMFSLSLCILLQLRSLTSNLPLTFVPSSPRLPPDGSLYSAMSSVGGQAGSIRRTFGSQKLLKTENVWLLSEWAGGSHAFRLMRAEMVGGAPQGATCRSVFCGPVCRLARDSICSRNNMTQKTCSSLNTV